ncbi:MAG TPA: nucleoside deaminase [Bacteroidia bacterium]|nr:nucleoside deaminase [Bacteroidia bacterium]
MRDHEYFMNEALKEAEKAYQKNEVPVGAIIVWNNKIIARSHNLTEQLQDVTAHAEIQAITAATNYIGGKYLTECTIYVTLEPCPMCAGALAWAQISTLVYGAYDLKKGYSLFSENILHPKTQVIKGVLADECKTILQKFFAERRK